MLGGILGGILGMRGVGLSHRWGGGAGGGKAPAHGYRRACCLELPLLLLLLWSGGGLRARQARGQAPQLGAAFTARGPRLSALLGVCCRWVLRAAAPPPAPR